MFTIVVMGIQTEVDIHSLLPGMNHLQTETLPWAIQRLDRP